MCCNFVVAFISRNLTSVQIVDDEVLATSTPSRYVHVVDPFASEITFNLGTCPSKKVLHVSCNNASELHTFNNFHLHAEIKKKKFLFS